MSQEKITILAVEDDIEDVALLSRNLEASHRWEVDLDSCSTSTDALALLGQRHFDLVLLDHHLGAERGFTVLRALRESGHHCPVVLLTGRGDEQLAVEALRSGVADYLPKSQLDPLSLDRVIDNAIGKARLHDVIDTHRRNLERTNGELARRNRAIEGFYHTVSHELRSPLTALQQFVAILEEADAGDVNQTQREYLSIMAESCDQMALCIDDLLDSTRLETGKLRIDRESIALRPLVDRVVKSMQLVGGVGVEVKTEVPEELPRVQVDSKRITQVLRNLIGNALKFTPEGGMIAVGAGLVPGSSELVRVSVTDTGCGMEPEQLTRIFERHYQVSDDDSVIGGLGLGLEICKQLIELHDGEITVESAVGRGSTFAFTLPVAATAKLLLEAQRSS